ncbi:MAG: hypothetical protein WCO42_09875 [bacterium]
MRVHGVMVVADAPCDHAIAACKQVLHDVFPWPRVQHPSAAEDNYLSPQRIDSDAVSGGDIPDPPPSVHFGEMVQRPAISVADVAVRRVVNIDDTGAHSVNKLRPLMGFSRIVAIC